MLQCSPKFATYWYTIVSFTSTSIVCHFKIFMMIIDVIIVVVLIIDLAE